MTLSSNTASMSLKVLSNTVDSVKRFTFFKKDPTFPDFFDAE
jgi:hypothetical protein